MKKILPLILIMFLGLGMHACFAADDSDENIDVYFTEEPTQVTPLNGYLDFNQSLQDQEVEQDQNAVLLDGTKTTGINITPPKSFNSKSLFANSKRPAFGPMQNGVNTSSNSIAPISAGYSRKYGKIRFGTTYGSSYSNARAKLSTGIFAKYEGKHFALGTGYSTTTDNSTTYSPFNDDFYIAPELKITKRLSLLDVMQADVMQINKSNEVVLRYTPHFKKYTDDVQLEVGAGQSFYDNNYINSSIRFSTKFKL